ncbi:hypothetical protein ACOSQ4_011152 [Xanthoceras sorbifolium]
MHQLPFSRFDATSSRSSLPLSIFNSLSTTSQSIYAIPSVSSTVLPSAATPAQFSHSLLSNSALLQQHSLPLFASPSAVSSSSTSSYSSIIPTVYNPHTVSSHLMVIRSKVGTFKPKVFSALCQSPYAKLTETEPTSVKTALAGPKWKLAMEEEYNALMRNNTWTLVPPSSNCNIVGHKWVFRIKYKPDGTVAKYKARLVAKGFHQTASVDFTETYNPVIKPSTIRVIFTLAVTFG